MIFEDFILTTIYLIAAFLVFMLGKVVYTLVNKSKFNLRHELLEQDNLAFALTHSGYFFGLVLAIGGVLFGPSHLFLEYGAGGGGVRGEQGVGDKGRNLGDGESVEVPIEGQDCLIKEFQKGLW